jgi:hypothetical protein
VPEALTVDHAVDSPVARDTAGRLAKPPEALWAACVAAQVVIAAQLTSYTYFFFDDFQFLRQAQTQGFGRGYLVERLYTHFSPITRLLNKLVVTVDPGSFAFAHGVQLALYAAAIAAFAFVVRGVLGRSWLALGLTVVFGQSVFLLRLLNWYTATVNLLPATIFMLVSLGCWLRWQERGGKPWLIASLVAFAGSLLDYETAMLFPGYLVMIRLLILETSLDPRHWLRVLWRERWSWVAFGVLDAAAIVNYYANYYVSSPKPGLSQLFHFTEIALVQAFTPALFGVARQPTPGTLAVLATGLCLCAIAAATLYCRPRAWRCLLVAFLALLLSLLPLGLNRIQVFGVYVGAELYYQQSAQFIFLVLVAFAWGPRFAEPGARRRLPHPRGRIGGPVVLALAAAYATLYVTSVDHLANAAWEPHAARAYFDRFLASVARVRSTTGRDPNLIDSTVSAGLMAANTAPYNRYSWFFPVITSRLRYNDVAPHSYLVDPEGALVSVRFAPRAAGRLGRPACAHGAHPQPVKIPVTPRIRVRASSDGQANAVKVSYRLPVRENVTVLASPVSGQLAEPVDGDLHLWGPGHGTGLAVIDAGMAVAEVDVAMPRGGCVNRLAVGSFVRLR